MAYKNYDELSSAEGTHSTGQTLNIANGETQLPDSSYIKDAQIIRDGADLVLDGPNGTITVPGYFTAEAQPTLTTPDGASLSPQLVNSFAQSHAQYAQATTMNDESPVGAVQELSGDATVTRLNGQIEPVSLGTPIYEGDVIETASNGALNIVFDDESSFAVSEDTRLAIDEYVYDSTGGGEGAQSFSVLKGVFVFTSGLVGRDDPDDVSIDTPTGSIGIRGTIIAGNVDEGEITVVEGAIVLRDNFGNETTLANQFETAKFMPETQEIHHMGELSANEMNAKFVGVAKVAPAMFSSIDDAANENADGNAPDAPAEAKETVDEVPQDSGEELQNPDNAKPAPEEAKEALQGEPEVQANPDGSLDQNGDNQVDGTIDEVGADKAHIMEVLKTSMAEQMMDTMQDMKQTHDMMDNIKHFMAEHDLSPAEMMQIMEQRAEDSSVDEGSEDGEGGIDTSSIDEGTTGPLPSEEEQDPIIVFNGNYNAEQGGAKYVGSDGADTFSNQQASPNIAHQDISVATKDGSDEITLHSDINGNLRLGTIHAGNDYNVSGFGDKVFLKFTNGANNVQIQEINGGAGAFDSLEIRGKAGAAINLNPGNIQKIVGIEKIDITGGKTEHLTFTADQVLTMTSTSEKAGIFTTSYLLDNGELNTDTKVVEIIGNTNDSISAALDGNWEKVVGSELSVASGGDYGAYTGYYHSESNSMLLIDDSTINTAGISGAIV